MWVSASDLLQTFFGVVSVAAAVALAVAGLYLFRRLVPLDILISDHDITGAKFQVMGTIYAVLLAFVVITVWQQYYSVSSTVEVEASKLLDLYRDAAEFPQPLQGEMRAHLEAYGRAVVDAEWDAMSRGHESVQARDEFLRLWKVYRQLPVRDLRELAAQNETINRMSELGENRQLRLLRARSRLPTVLWVVLLIGAVATIGFSYFFGARSVRLQAVMVAIFTSAIALFFFVIAALDTPFSGAGWVSPEPFKRALHTMIHVAAPPP